MLINILIIYIILLFIIFLVLFFNLNKIILLLQVFLILLYNIYICNSTNLYLGGVDDEIWTYRNMPISYFKEYIFNNILKDPMSFDTKKILKEISEKNFLSKLTKNDIIFNTIHEFTTEIDYHSLIYKMHPELFDNTKIQNILNMTYFMYDNTNVSVLNYFIVNNRYDIVEYLLNLDIGIDKDLLKIQESYNMDTLGIFITSTNPNNRNNTYDNKSSDIYNTIRRNIDEVIIDVIKDKIYILLTKLKNESQNKLFSILKIMYNSPSNKALLIQVNLQEIKNILCLNSLKIFYAKFKFLGDTLTDVNFIFGLLSKSEKERQLKINMIFNLLYKLNIDDKDEKDSISIQILQILLYSQKKNILELQNEIISELNDLDTDIRKNNNDNALLLIVINKYKKNPELILKQILELKLILQSETEENLLKIYEYIYVINTNSECSQYNWTFSNKEKSVLFKIILDKLPEFEINNNPDLTIISEFQKDYKLALQKSLDKLNDNEDKFDILLKKILKICLQISSDVSITDKYDISEFDSWINAGFNMINIYLVNLLQEMYPTYLSIFKTNKINQEKKTFKIIINNYIKQKTQNIKDFNIEDIKITNLSLPVYIGVYGSHHFFDYFKEYKMKNGDNFYENIKKNFSNISEMILEIKRTKPFEFGEHAYGDMNDWLYEIELFKNTYTAIEYLLSNNNYIENDKLRANELMNQIIDVVINYDNDTTVKSELRSYIINIMIDILLPKYKFYTYMECLITLYDHIISLLNENIVEKSPLDLLNSKDIDEKKNLSYKQLLKLSNLLQLFKEIKDVGYSYISENNITEYNIFLAKIKKSLEFNKNKYTYEIIADDKDKTPIYFNIIRDFKNNKEHIKGYDDKPEYIISILEYLLLPEQKKEFTVTKITKDDLFFQIILSKSRRREQYYSKKYLFTNLDIIKYIIKILETKSILELQNYIYI